MVEEMINRPCTVIENATAEARDEYNNPIKDPTSRDSVCELQQRSRGEVADESDISSTTWVAFFLPGESLDRVSQIEVDGQIFEFDGDPWAARNPITQEISHIEATLILVEGDREDVESGS
jgi:hypothetical protein